MELLHVYIYKYPFPFLSLHGVRSAFFKQIVYIGWQCEKNEFPVQTLESDGVEEASKDTLHWLLLFFPLWAKTPLKRFYFYLSKFLFLEWRRLPWQLGFFFSLILIQFRIGMECLMGLYKIGNVFYFILCHKTGWCYVRGGKKQMGILEIIP